MWSDAKPEGQAILRAIAQNKTPPENPAALRWLREHDVLNADNKFFVPLVRRWVLSQIDG